MELAPARLRLPPLATPPPTFAVLPRMELAPARVRPPALTTPPPPTPVDHRGCRVQVRDGKFQAGSISPIGAALAFGRDRARV
jgi:hypothetical protein